jgi:ATP-dependent Clp protease ATP-binding subunit ClpB
VDFKNTIIIMTSNVGSQMIQELAGRDQAEMERRVMEALRAGFKPEFLNRIDEMIIFLGLAPEQIAAIVDIQMQHLAKRLAERRMTLTLSDAARDFLARKGYDRVYGARPLKRAIQQYIENPLAMDILRGRFGDGDHIRADLEGDAIVFAAD